jgi:hypothetical protein
MAALDRLGWAMGSAASVHGVKVGLRVTDPGSLPALEARLPAGWRRARGSRVDVLLSVVSGGRRSGVRSFYLLYVDAARRARVLERDRFLEAFSTEIEELVAVRSPTRIFVHAGVVAVGGRAVVIPGASGAGKSTLVSALVRAGGRYYSDEYAVFDARGRVHAFPRPLRLRGSDGVARQEAAGRAARPPLPVGLLVFTSFEPRARWRPARLSDGRTLLELVRHTLSVRRAPRRALAALRPAASAPALIGPRREAAEAAREILREMERMREDEPRGRALHA